MNTYTTKFNKLISDCEKLFFEQEGGDTPITLMLRAAGGTVSGYILICLLQYLYLWPTIEGVDEKNIHILSKDNFGTMTQKQFNKAVSQLVERGILSQEGFRIVFNPKKTYKILREIHEKNRK